MIRPIIAIALASLWLSSPVHAGSAEPHPWPSTGGGAWLPFASPAPNRATSADELADQIAINRDWNTARQRAFIADGGCEGDFLPPSVVEACWHLYVQHGAGDNSARQQIGASVGGD